MARRKRHLELTIPDDLEWPVEGRDPETGALIVGEGFVDLIEELNDLALGTLGEEDVEYLLAKWYLRRRAAGAPDDPAMDELVRDEKLELPPEGAAGN